MGCALLLKSGELVFLPLCLGTLVKDFLRLPDDFASVVALVVRLVPWQFHPKS